MATARTRTGARTRRTDKPRRDHAQEITDRIVSLIETAAETGAILPWRRPWRRAASGAPTRVTGEAYQGVNNFWLGLLGASMGYASPVWMTFRQAQELGGAVRKGEKSAPVVYYGVGGTAEDDSGSDENETSEGERGGRYRFLKGYAVFNCDQIDGLPERFQPVPEAELDAGARPIGEIEAFFARIPVKIETGGERAFYREAGDTVFMPDISRFEDPSRYYAVALHEMAHASGIERRLSRPCFTKYHDDRAERAEEELVAEIASAIAGPRLELPTDHTDDHAAYVASWLAALRNDSRFILKAAANAQRAVDWIFDAAGEAKAEPDAHRRSTRIDDAPSVLAA